MRKNKIILSILCFFALLFQLCGCIFEFSPIYIFADISECENIEKLKHEDAIITVYDTPEKDKNAKGLEYEKFFAAEYDSSELEFEIFAYEFKDGDTAKKYFRNETGKKDDRDINFSSSKGMFGYILIVINDNMAYSALSSSADADELEDFLANVFSLNLDSIVESEN